MIKETFPLSGLACAACAARAEKVLRGCDGVKEANVNFAASSADVTFDPATVTPEDLRQAIHKAGYELLIDAATERIEEEERRRYKALRRRMWYAVALSVPVMIIGMFFMHMPYADILMFILSTPVVFIFGRQFFIGAWRQLRHRTANMDTLVALSTGIAWLFSVANMLFPSYWLSRGITPHVYFEASAVIVAFILLGRTLESRARGNTSSAIRRLMGLQPKTVLTRQPDGSLKEKEIADVAAGELLIARPGEGIAVDGTVEEGSSYVDESMLSGEPIPVGKEKESPVYAGTINGNGSLTYHADKVGAETLLSRIIRMVRDAQGSKAPVQKLADRIAAVFVPSIIIIAIVSFAAWMLLDPAEGFSHGLLAAVTVLVIACPCALGLATPSAIMVGIGQGARYGILIKDAESLEIAPKVNAMVLDKTGTLTVGKPEVTAVRSYVADSRLTEVLSAIESRSDHPIAHAVAAYFGHSDTLIDDFINYSGEGVAATVDGTRYYAGNSRLMARFGINVTPEQAEEAARLEKEAYTVVRFASEHGLIALIGVSDPVKPDSAAAVKSLQEMGIEVYMLTGDNRQAAEAIALSVGIRNVEAEVMPHEKAAFVERLQSEGKRVAMAGDGINDSAALAKADLSIAMGTGSDIAMDVAKMTIVSAELSRIPVGLRLSKATVRTIRQNLFWAFIYNLIGVPIAAGIMYPINGFLLNPMIAGAAMAFSSVSVVGNSLLLARKKFQ